MIVAKSTNLYGYYQSSTANLYLGGHITFLVRLNPSELESHPLECSCSHPKRLRRPNSPTRLTPSSRLVFYQVPWGRYSSVPAFVAMGRGFPMVGIVPLIERFCVSQFSEISERSSNFVCARFSVVSIRHFYECKPHTSDQTT